MPVKGVGAEPVCPLPAGGAGGSGSTSVGSPGGWWLTKLRGLSPRVQLGHALGAKGRAEMCLWEWWCFMALLGGKGVCKPRALELEAMLASMPGHGASDAYSISILAEGLSSASSSPGC